MKKLEGAKVLQNENAKRFAGGRRRAGEGKRKNKYIYTLSPYLTLNPLFIGVAEYIKKYMKQYKYIKNYCFFSCQTKSRSKKWLTMPKM